MPLSSPRPERTAFVSSDFTNFETCGLVAKFSWDDSGCVMDEESLVSIGTGRSIKTMQNSRQISISRNETWASVEMGICQRNSEAWGFARGV